MNNYAQNWIRLGSLPYGSLTSCVQSPPRASWRSICVLVWNGGLARPFA